VNLARRSFGEIFKEKSVAAGTKIETGMKKAISLAKRVRKSGVDSQMERQEQPKIEREQEAPVETSHVEKPSLDTQEYGQVTPNARTPSGNLAMSSKGQGSNEIAAECFTCENLIRCDFRSNLSAESGGQAQKGVSCSFANRREIEQIKIRVEQ